LRGFTLIEAMIAITLLTFSLLGVVAMQVYFGSETTDKTLKNCLLDQATSALSYKRATGDNPNTSFTCDNGTVSGSMSMSESTVSAYCKSVTATATAKGKSLSLNTLICNF